MKDELPDGNMDTPKICNVEAYYQTVIKNMVLREKKTNRAIKENIVYVPMYDVVPQEKLAFYDDYGIDNHIIPVEEFKMVIKSDLLAEALSRLSEEKRLVIYKSYFWDMSDRELAYEFGCTYDAMRQRRSRIIKEMRDYMERRYESEWINRRSSNESN